MENDDKKPSGLYNLIMALIAITPLVFVAIYVYINRDSLLSAYVSRQGTDLLARLSEEDKQEIYNMLSRQTDAIWEAVPEPLVANILRVNTATEYANAPLYTNNAGMRSKRPYTRKTPDKFRIICLGDSFVFGQGAHQKDRFGDQIEGILKGIGPIFDNKDVEVYSLGLPGWNSLQEAAYLTSRISSYEPDIVLVFMVGNDLDDNFGVLGTGVRTTTFSPQNRNLGSGVVGCLWPGRVSNKIFYNLLLYDVCPESRTRWREAFAAWKRLEEVLERSGAKMVLGIGGRNYPNDLFYDLSKFFHHESGMKSPLIMMCGFDNKLDEGHYNRKGNEILATHYLHTLANLGWLPLKSEDFPVLDPRLSTETVHIPDMDSIHKRKSGYFPTLAYEIDFEKLSNKEAKGIIGGIYRGRENARGQFHGSIKSVFLLRRNQKANKVFLEIEVPPFVELYPFSLEMRLNGQPAGVLVLENEQQAGKHLIEGIIPNDTEFKNTVEIALFTQSYWTSITDHTMRSYRLVSCRQEKDK